MMAEGAGPNLEARLVARLLDIFPDYGEQMIRDSVYSALVGTNGAANINEEVLINQCIDGLLMPAPAVGAKRVAAASETEEAKRARQNGSMGETSWQISPNSSMQSNGSGESDRSFSIDEQGPIGPAFPVNHAELERKIRLENDSRMITDMFPWIQPPWVTEQLSQPNMNADHLIDYILANQSKIPKKEKPKPKAAPVATSSTVSEVSATKNVAPPSPVIKDYLNDYANFTNYGNHATQYLSSAFPWLYMNGITQVLSKFHNHLAPAYNVLLQATKGVDFRTHPLFIRVKIGEPGLPEQIVNVKVLKSPRSSGVPPIAPWTWLAPQLQDEIVWINKHFHGQEDKVVKVEAAAPAVASPLESAPTTEKPQTDEELKLERARERGDVYECGICCGEYIISEQMIACADGHLFCTDCLRNYSREAIYGQTKADLFCMNDDCKARFPHEMVIKALDAESLKKLEEKRMFEALNTAGIEGLERCKYCNYAVIFDVPPEVNKVFKCSDPSCEREYCRICQVDWEEHMGKPCKEVETEDDTRKRREAEERMAAAIIRHCNKCKAPLIKEEGCNKLICSCGGIMCYICRQTIRGYDHFCQHARDPSNPGCKLCTNCSLWEDPKLKDSVAVKQIQTEVKKVLADSGKELKIGVEEASPVRANQQPIRAPQAPQRGIRVHAQQQHRPHFQQQVRPHPAIFPHPQVQPNAQPNQQQQQRPDVQLPQAQVQMPNYHQGQNNLGNVVRPNGAGNVPNVPAQVAPPVAAAVLNARQRVIDMAYGAIPNPFAQGNGPMVVQYPAQFLPRPAAHGGARPRDYNALPNIVPQVEHNANAGRRPHAAPAPPQPALPNHIGNVAPPNLLPQPNPQQRLDARLAPDGGYRPRVMIFPGPVNMNLPPGPPL